MSTTQTQVRSTEEALKLALEALEKLTNAAEGFSVSGVYFNEELWARKCLDDAYDAMGFAQEALAQPEQEPVAWRAPNWGHGDDEWVYRDFDDPVLIADGKPSPNNEPLYTTPYVATPRPQRTAAEGEDTKAWVGLADEEIEALARWADEHAAPWYLEFARAIEADLKAKNERKEKNNVSR